MRTLLNDRERYGHSLAKCHIAEALKLLVPGDPRRGALARIVESIELDLAEKPVAGLPDLGDGELGDGWHAHRVDLTGCDRMPVGEATVDLAGAAEHPKADPSPDERAAARRERCECGEWPSPGTPEAAEFGAGTHRRGGR